MKPYRLAWRLWWLAGLLLLICLLGCSGENNHSAAETTPAAAGGDDPLDDQFPDRGEGEPIDDDTYVAPPSEPFDPDAPGPYPVGNRTLLLIDENRWDPYLHSWRPVLAEVWYPTEDWAENLPRDILANFLNGWDELILSVFELLGVPSEELANLQRETGSARNAPLRADRAPYPVLFFSHGNAAIRFQNYTQCEYLASHGYVVVAPDHVENAVFVTYPDDLIIFNPLWMPLSYLDRQKDIHFLVDRFTALNRDDPESFFTGRLDMDKIGVFGHSFGANTAQEVVKWDRRFRAAVAYAGPQVPLLPADFQTPILTMFGMEDHTMHDWEFLIRFNYAQRPSPKIMMGFVNAGHYSFTDACLIVPTLFGAGDGCGTSTRFDTGEEFAFIEHDLAMSIVNTYVTAWFGLFVKGQPAMAPYLTADLHPEEVTYFREFSPAGGR